MLEALLKRHGGPPPPAAEQPEPARAAEEELKSAVRSESSVTLNEVKGTMPAWPPSLRSG